MPSPTCTVNASSTTGGVNVSAASTITIQLASLAGVSSWSITCIGRDENASAPSLSINSTTQTATFTSGAAGSAYVFESVVNGGRNNGEVESSYTTRFAVFVLTARGKRVGAYELTTEGDATFGWIPIINSAIRLAETGVTYGAYSSIPSGGVAGRMYVASDAPVAQWIDDRTEYRPLVNGMIPGYKPTAAASWTAYNAGGATIADSNGALLINGASDAAITLRGWEQTYSNATAYVDACFDMHSDTALTAGYFSEFGVFMRESGTGKLAALMVAYNHSGYLTQYVKDNWTSATTRTVNTALSFGQPGSAPVFLRLERNSTNLLYRVSRDRVTWNTLSTDAITTPFTTAPDRVGIVTLGLNVVPRGVVRHYKHGSA